MNDELAVRRGSFERAIQKLVAQLGLTGNRFSTALVYRMEEAGRNELRARAEVILGTWVRCLSNEGTDPENLDSARTTALEILKSEFENIVRVLAAVGVGSIARNEKFLDQQFHLTSARLTAELNVTPLTPTESSPEHVVELKPNIYGIGFDLRALVRRLAIWWRKRNC